MTNVIRFRYDKNEKRLSVFMIYCYWLSFNIVTICSQQKKKNDVLVVIFSILLHFMKTAILWLFHTIFAIEKWRTMWSETEVIAEVIDKKLNWCVKTDNCQMTDSNRLIFKSRMSIFSHWVNLSRRRKRVIINWLEVWNDSRLT